MGGMGRSYAVMRLGVSPAQPSSAAHPSAEALALLMGGQVGPASLCVPSRRVAGRQCYGGLNRKVWLPLTQGRHKAWHQDRALPLSDW